ncbi:MAG: hypothetical protein EPN68_01010 [Rhodanobacter sp.]|nr:MAG: hypothetical protein EPN68_01010 [Rhodanobacter sp.]
MADLTKTEPARLVASAKFAKAALETRHREFEGIKARAEADLKAAQAKLKAAMAPPSNPGDACLFQNIRQHLRSLPTGDRVRLLEQAKAEGDNLTLLAAIAGPTFLSLAPDDLRGGYQDAFLANTVPNDLGHATRLLDALQSATDGMAQLDAHANKLIDFPTADAIERSAS